jgi:hypothetical protein
MTGLGRIAEKLSEVSLNSDRFDWKTGKAVKSSYNFRQVWAENRKSCQKKLQLQTGLIGKQGKLSKEAPTSDRFEEKTRKAVKRSPNFRQVWVENRKSCQKKLQLQTGLGGKQGKLSKEAPTSDRFGRKTGKAVKRSSNFRQV